MPKWLLLLSCTVTSAGSVTVGVSGVELAETTVKIVSGDFGNPDRAGNQEIPGVEPAETPTVEMEH